MKKSLIASYVFGIKDTAHGENYPSIMRYFIPEFITALVLYSVLYLLDAKWIADLKSTAMYATLGITNTLLHFIVKSTEGLSVGAIVLSGKHNGEGDYKEAGKTFVDAIWMALVVGLLISGFLYFGAYHIYTWYGVPEEMIVLGIPFLRLRALGVFFMCIYFACIGFMRGLKDTKTPMKIFILGGVVYLFFDYVLIFGKFGFPVMGLLGSALATVIQYAVMFLASVVYIVWNKKTRYQVYQISLGSIFKGGDKIKELMVVSWPVMVDKAALAASYVWLAAMLAPLGKSVLAAFSVVKDLERFALLPAVAFAQVITFLVSNDFGRKNWPSIKSNIKKIVFLSSFMVFSILLVFSLWPSFFIQIFDKEGDFTVLAATVFPILSMLVFFDLLQLILSGAMRGVMQVKRVMITRLIVFLFYFAPVSYILSLIHFENVVLKFILIYGAFYIGNAFMSIVYINQFRKEGINPEGIDIHNRAIKNSDPEEL